MKKLLALIVGLLAFTSAAFAQGSGQLPAGGIWGNPSASKAPAQATTVGAVLDQGLSCSGRGSIIMRGASAWTCKGPGTTALPLVSLGPGADLAYATLTVAGGGTGLNSGTSGGIPYFSASNTIASSAALTANRIVLGGGAGAAPTVLGSLGTTTTVLHGNAAGAPTFGAVSLTADVTGNLPLANIATGTQDTALGYWGSTAVSAIAVNNCTTALTYSTASHTFGCNAGAGTGNVVNSGTPTANQVARWVDAVTIQGVNVSSLLSAGSGISITGTTTATIAQSLTNAVLQGSPAAPTGTTSATQVMMGLGVSTCRVTLVYSTRMRISVAGTVASTSSGAQVSMTLRYGTGAGPANGAAVSGTTPVPAISPIIPGTNYPVPFNTEALVTGLSAGTTYWIDVSLGTTAGTASFAGVACNAMEF